MGTARKPDHKIPIQQHPTVLRSSEHKTDTYFPNHSSFLRMEPDPSAVWNRVWFHTRLPTPSLPLAEHTSVWFRALLVGSV